MPLTKPTIDPATVDATAGLKTSIQTATDFLCDAVDATNSTVTDALATIAAHTAALNANTAVLNDVRRKLRRLSMST